MNLIRILIILLFLQNCSFDDKTGIWKNERSVSINSSKDKIFEGFEKIAISEETFNKVIELDSKIKLRISKPIKTQEWNDIYYNQNNNYPNINYNDSKKITFKSKKLSRYKINDQILFDKNNLIFSNEKGDIIVYSLTKNQIISKFNFYKKKFKKINKILNLKVDKEVIYTTDNLGYVYAYNYRTENILWAENYKIPFRSNLKILNNKLVFSDQNNNLYFIDKNKGNLLRLVPTEETVIKNHFINNLSTDNVNSLFYLNSYGSLYSLNINSMRINWFINLNKSFDINPTNMFIGNKIVNNDKFIIVSSNSKSYVINLTNGTIISKKNFSSSIKPIINNNLIFLITKNNLILSMDLTSGKILYSYNINDQIAEFLKIKKKNNLNIKNFTMLNSQLILFLNNSYILKFNINGKLNQVLKLPTKISSQPIIINGAILYLNNKNKLVKFD